MNYPYILFCVSSINNQTPLPIKKFLIFLVRFRRNKTQKSPFFKGIRGMKPNFAISLNFNPYSFSEGGRVW